MNKYVLIIEPINKATITKNGNIYWNIKFEPSISSFAFSAINNTGEHYQLKSKGLFWWRKLTLFHQSKAVESFAITKSLDSNISLDSRAFIYRNHEYLFSLDRAERSVEGKGAWFTWNTDEENIEATVFTLALLNIQRHQHGSGGSAGMLLANDI